MVTAIILEHSLAPQVWIGKNRIADENHSAEETVPGPPVPACPRHYPRSGPFNTQGWDAAYQLTPSPTVGWEGCSSKSLRNAAGREQWT